MTLKDITESMRVGYAARLVKILVPDTLFAFETQHGIRLLVERQNGKTVVYSFHCTIGE